MSQGADTKAAGRGGASEARKGLRRFAASMADWLRSKLFLRTAPGPVGWRKILLAITCVIAGAAVSLARTTGPGALNTIWIEDAKYLLDQALSKPFLQCISTPISGYFQATARLITEIAVQFPVAWEPGVMSALAATQYALYGLVAYIASAPHLNSRWLRLLVAAPICVVPLGYTQANNDLVTVQFFALYGAFWALLWVPGTRAGRVLSPLVMLSAATTTVLIVVYTPLVLARLVADRSRNAMFLAGCWFFGAIFEMSPTLRGQAKHYAYGYNSPLFVLQNYADRAVPRALFGESALGGPGTDYKGRSAPLHIINGAGHVALIGGAWVVVVAVLVIAFTRLTDPDWPLMATAALFSVGIFTAELLINVPIVPPRYVIAPALLLYVVLVAALRPRQALKTRTRSVLSWLPVSGLAVLLAVAVTLNFRVVNGRTTSPPWTSVVARAQLACARPGVLVYTYSHEWWHLNIPCSRLK